MSRTVLLTCLFLFAFGVSPAPVAAADDGEQSSEVRRALAASAAFFRKNPDKREFFFPEGFLLPEVDDEVLTTYRKSTGEEAVTRLTPVRNRLVDLGLSLTATSSRRNVLRLYKLIYSKLPKQVRSKIDPYSSVKELPLKELKKKFSILQQVLHRRFDFILTKLPPSELIVNPILLNPIGDCSSEVGGESAGSDSEISARCAVTDYSSDGLFINFDFPVKNDLTCIKDQGRRGTCVAHAIAATVESRELWRGGPAQNLSEQHIYYTGEKEGDSRISITNMQTSGLSAGTTMQQYENDALPFYYERDWNYNRSSFIDPITFDGPTATFSYPNSCIGAYTGESCDDYVWQTGATLPILGFPEPRPAPTGPSVIHRLSSFSYFLADGPNGLMTQIALETAIILLAGDVPMVLSMTSTDAFASSTDGYVRYTAGDSVRGGHAVQLIGFVGNSQLPAGVTAATERGYFIIKNSWGIDSGDCGFYYLDFGYLLRYLEYVSVLEIQ